MTKVIEDSGAVRSVEVGRLGLIKSRIILSEQLVLSDVTAGYGRKVTLPIHATGTIGADVLLCKPIAKGVQLRFNDNMRGHVAVDGEKVDLRDLVEEAGPDGSGRCGVRLCAAADSREGASDGYSIDLPFPCRAQLDFEGYRVLLGSVRLPVPIPLWERVAEKVFTLVALAVFAVLAVVGVWAIVEWPLYALGLTALASIHVHRGSNPGLWRATAALISAGLLVAGSWWGLEGWKSEIAERCHSTVECRVGLTCSSYGWCYIPEGVSSARVEAMPSAGQVSPHAEGGSG